ncbi:peptidase [Deinococcus aetherius]|uniref:Peptidase n=1 Tax=Deinococcus aetherius TaxID=200252 RepID=A0ABM8ABT9_9DEIO|nr:C40 family peptidase [Deinococcus aetherius]BDP41238.1 peptidase [Deinococcus aetherius]
MTFLPRFLLPLTLLTLASGAGASLTGGGAGPLPPAVPASAEGPLTVTVQPGDTAFRLARAHGLSVEVLLALNGLSGPDLRVGQVLRVREVPPYTVQPGETLYSLARRFGVSVDALLAANTLPTDTVLRAGQVLLVPGPGPGVTAPAPAVTAGQPPVPDLAPPLTAVPVASSPDVLAPEPLPGDALAAPLPGDWRGAALALLGVPYVYGGSTLAGLDCSGLVLQVFAPLGLNLPRRSAEQAQVGLPVAAGELQPGDLVFFDTEGRGTVTHVGIYLGEDEFLNANSYRGGVVVDHLLSDRYWAPRLVGARRVLPPTTYASGR